MDISVLSFDDVKILAKSIDGVKIHHKTKEETYRSELQAYINDNPDCLPDEPEDSITESTEGSKEKKPKELKKGFVKIKSIHVGKMGSSVGEVDFGTDGIATVTVEQAEHFCKIEGFEEC